MSAAPRLQSMAPWLPPRPRYLVLGSMPGQASLRAARYYAHPRNQFWPLLAAVFNCPQPADWPAREALLRHGAVALWDVLASCEREGSLDSAIRRARPNPIAALLAAQPTITRVGLNGARAASDFARYVRVPAGLRVVALPSSSPANARLRFEQKLASWRALRESEV